MNYVTQENTITPLRFGLWWLLLCQTIKGGVGLCTFIIDMRTMFLRKSLWCLFVLVLLCVILFALINFYIVSSFNGDFECSGEKPSVVLVFGARVYASGRLSDMFRDRVDTALELYQTGQVSKILVSGDHGQVEYDEVGAARDYLLAQGVLAEDIFLDHAGFDTYDSLYRAREVFGVREAVLVTQSYHLPRALFIADKLGLQASGQKADQRLYRGQEARVWRERFARVKAVFNVLLQSKPTYLGPMIPIEGDGRESW